ncbi:hypothetical protein, partial [Psychrobacter sp. TB55-MNA-CIBAN-0194]|uniref:hypothetical protein n=1 Tax=Psychrobacter sp. TB55-MNA-CIBAN-0194 TaxID=3140445 RepID=UPI003330F470
GTLRNAISRDANATINVASKDEAVLLAFISEFEKVTQAEFISTEANLTVSLVPAELDYELEASAKNILLSAIYCAPHGVHRMSAELDGVTET